MLLHHCWDTSPSFEALLLLFTWSVQNPSFSWYDTCNQKVCYHWCFCCGVFDACHIKIHVAFMKLFLLWLSWSQIKFIFLLKEAIRRHNELSNQPFPFLNASSEDIYNINLADHLTYNFTDSKGRIVAVFDNVVPKEELDTLRNFFMNKNSAYSYGTYDPDVGETHDNVNWIVQQKVRFCFICIFTQYSFLAWLQARSPWRCQGCPVRDVRENIIESVGDIWDVMVISELSELLLKMAEFLDLVLTLDHANLPACFPWLSFKGFRDEAGSQSLYLEVWLYYADFNCIQPNSK